MRRKIDIVSLSMCMLALICMIINNFMITMESRIAKLKGISAINCLGEGYWVLLGAIIILFILSIMKKDNITCNFITGLWASLLIGLTIYLTSTSVNYIEFTTKNFRVTWGLGVYLLMFTYSSIIIKCNVKLKKSWQKFINSMLGISIIVGLLVTGTLDSLSIMVEYHKRYEMFNRELIRHIKLCLTVVISGVIIGIPVGYLTYKNQRIEKIVNFFLNISQAIPSIAAILILVFVLSALSRAIPILRVWGISGFGVAPVFCALFLYSQFQIVNSVRSALKTIEGKYLEVASALGMTQRDIMLKIQIPMVMPVIISGIRITIIHTFSAATLGAIVGFGGLGLIITRAGSGGVAIDMILLGTIPIMVMIFACDFLLNCMVNFISNRLHLKFTN